MNDNWTEEETNNVKLVADLALLAQKHYGLETSLKLLNLSEQFFKAFPVELKKVKNKWESSIRNNSEKK